MEGMFAVIEPQYGVFQYVDSGLAFEEAVEIASQRIAETYGGDVYVVTTGDAERVVNKGIDEVSFVWYTTNGELCKF